MFKIYNKLHPFTSVLLALFLIIFICKSSYGKKLPPLKKCQTEQECQMRASHFVLYSYVKDNLENNLKNLQGKDLAPLIRSVELLSRRFERQEVQKLNGTDLVLELLRDEKLLKFMEVLQSDEGRQLSDLYKSSINGQEQNLACSKLRVNEIEAAAEKLNKNQLLGEVFSNVHRNFVERSGRKCMRTLCTSISENMNRLDGVLRSRHRTNGKRKFPLGISGQRTQATGAGREPIRNARDEKSETSDNLEPIETVMKNEFQDEELELCRFFKRTNSTNCQASGKELSQIDFSDQSDEQNPADKPPEVANSVEKANGTWTSMREDKLANKVVAFLADYETTLRQTGDGLAMINESGSASQVVLNKCSAIRPVLKFHLFGLRWYMKQNLIHSDRLQTRSIWCPSLSYWLQIDRLCDQLGTNLAQRDGVVFAY